MTLESKDVLFTGERFLPTCTGEIAYEHWHRYAFASSFATGRRVLDVASGEGYGAALLSGFASSVSGVDIDADTVRNATAKYSRCDNLQFLQASCTALPFADKSFDLIVSLETIEHIDAEAQNRMIHEFERLLSADGLLFISSPNKAVYSDARGCTNEYHVCELYREDLTRLLSRQFSTLRWFHQHIQFWSGIWNEEDSTGRVETWLSDGSAVMPFEPPDAMYYLVLATQNPNALPPSLPRGSLLSDCDNSVLRRFEANTKEVIRQYKLIDELSAGADKQTGHIQHLERLVRELYEGTDNQARHVQHLEHLVMERDSTIARISREFDELGHRTLQLQDEVLANKAKLETQRIDLADLAQSLRERETWSWWLRFPVRRLRAGGAKK